MFLEKKKKLCILFFDFNKSYFSFIAFDFIIIIYTKGER